MQVNKLNIAEFNLNPSLGSGLKLMLTVKSFNLGDIRKRYVASRANKSGRAGSVERREPAVGGLCKVEFGEGKLESAVVLKEMKEPRGIAKNEKYFAYSSENHVVVQEGDEEWIIDNPWFSFIHALDFSPYNPDLLLISSSGFDCIFEYNVKTREKTWEWFAWEHFKNDALDPETKEPVYLTRNPEEHKQWSSEGKQVKLIDDPVGTYLPTAMRAAFINTVTYSRRNKGKIIGTLFHEGKSIEIDMESNQSFDHITGLSNPHGAWRFQNFDMASSTTGGMIFSITESVETQYDLSHLPGKHKEMEGKEWVQNAIFVNGLFICIDSNRTSFILFDPQKEHYNQISFNSDWAIQDLIVLQLTVTKSGL